MMTSKLDDTMLISLDARKNNLIMFTSIAKKKTFTMMRIFDIIDSITYNDSSSQKK